MKWLMTALLFLPIYTFSQIQKEQLREKSKLESFSEKSGTLIKKTFTDIGKVKDMKIQVLSIEDVTNETKINGIVFEANVYSSLSSDTKNALLDKDEIDGLLQTLNYFKDKVIGTSPSDYTEVIFSSRSGFSASIFQYQKDWSIAFKLERYGSNSSVYFKSKDLPELINLVGQAKARL